METSIMRQMKGAVAICSTVLLLAPAQARGQTRALGVLLGPISTVQTRDREDDSQSHAGFTVGAWAEVGTPTPWLTVVAEGAVARRGATYVLTDGFERQIDVDYLTAAVLPTVRASVGPAAIVAFGGPAIDVLLNSQASLELQGPFRFATGQVLAGIAGAGIEYVRGKTTFRIDGRINEQLSDAFEGEVDDVRHRSFELVFRLGMRPNP